MQETGREDRQQSGTELVGSSSYSGPLGGGPPNKRAGKRSAGFSIPENREGHEEPYMEVTLDVQDDSVAVHSVKPANGDKEDNDITLLAKGMKRKSASNVVRNASARIKQVSQEFKRYASFSKRPPPVRLERTKTSAAYALKGLKFISKTDGASGWPAVEKRFDEITASSNGLLPRSRFCECIGMKESKEFAGELFNALARKRNITGDSICKEELRQFWEQISDQSFDSRLQTFFDMVDKDADGKLTEVEVREIITLSASANKLSSIQKKAEEYARLIMEELDPEKHGYIMIENLETLLLQGAKQSAIAGESKKLGKMLSQKLKPTLDDNPVRRWCRRTKYFILDNWQRFWVMALWIGVMAGLFAYKYVQYRHRAAYEVMGSCVCIAKGAAEILKLNMALILLPVCRNTLTWLRNKTKLSVVVPFDDHLNFHKVIAVGITIGVGIHGIFHLACDFPRLIHASAEKWKLMEPFFGNHHTNYSYFLKSVEGVTGIIMVILMGIAFTLATSWFRRGQIKNNFLKKLTGFNAFWYSHHLFIIVYTLLIVHGHYLYLAHEWYKKTTWMYLAVPITIYAGERLIRALRSSTEAVTIKKAAIYSGNVLALHMSKPQGFRYKSGQYMFVNCAAVSPFEWHPFSITSAPGDDYLSVHIRAVGDWTNELRNVFTKACQPPTTGKSGLLRADCFQGNNNPNLPRVLIDGPYGAPAQDFWKYEVVLLVGLGIGATPMISIVKDIARNLRAMEEEANAIENGTLDTRNNSSPARKLSPNSQKRREHFKIRRAYFYWVTKEQGSFDWFKGAMDEVVELDHNHVIELHNYCTSVYEEDDVRSALITMLQQLNHAKNGVDIVSGTRVKSHFAKPDWHNVYKNIALNHPDSRVGVFYCGMPALAKELRHFALDFCHKTSTKFDFHKENF